jgi:hypothetical protein
MDVQAEEARLTGILHMAFGFASMARTFKPGSKVRFLQQVRAVLPRLGHAKDRAEFDALHDEICRWGCRSLKPSHAGRARASYGQVAKTLNVILKVAVYYCGLPDQVQATRLSPWLHPAIDNPMMKHLRRRYREDFPKGIKSISGVDKHRYLALLDLAARDAAENLGGDLHPVQWEDILWAEVNDKT